MKTIATVCLLYLLLLPSVPLQAETGEEIMQHVLDSQQITSSAMDIEMTLAASNSTESTRRIQTLVLDTDELSATITVFLEPASVRNTRFLTIEHQNRPDDQWIYLPSLRRVRRIAATEKDTSFMGSDFSYSDMSYSQGSVEESTHKWLRDEKIGDRLCAVVESIPLPEADSGYAREVSWVDRATWLPLKVEFFGADSETPVKRMEAGDIKQIDGHWMTGSITMTTIGTGHSTRLDFKQVRFDIPLDPGYFTTVFLETGRKP